MQIVNIKLDFVKLKTADLPECDRALYDPAVNSARHAYAPYSGLSVGAAVLLRDGGIVCGSNQENVAYPSGLCAERVALFAVGALYPDIPPVALAVVAMKEGEVQKFVSPCGACRQVMLETENRYGQSMRILMCGADDTVISSSSIYLLPLCFEYI